jgi:hypothetical protein
MGAASQAHVASLAAVRDGPVSFIRSEVVPPHEKELLTGPHRRYAKDGHYYPGGRGADARGAPRAFST